MEKSKIKIGSIFLRFLGWYTVAIAILWIFVTDIMFVSDFAAYTGQTYSNYLASSPKFAEIYIITKKLIGIMLLVIGFMIILINEFAYRKGEKWSWFALLISGGIAWGAFIIYKMFIGYIGVSMITFIIGAALLFVGLVLPVKEILGK
ncbi:MAG: hypothetical protein ACFFHD_02335 [Promethearchaeota archaeon]